MHQASAWVERAPLLGPRALHVCAPGTSDGQTPVMCRAGSQEAQEDNTPPLMQQDVMVPDSDERQQGTVTADEDQQAAAPAATPATPASQLEQVLEDAVTAALAQEPAAGWPTSCPAVYYTVLLDAVDFAE